MVRVRDVVITGICAVLVTQDAMTIGVMMTVSYIAGLIKKQIPQSEASDIYSQEISDARMT